MTMFFLSAYRKNAQAFQSIGYSQANSKRSSIQVETENANKKEKAKFGNKKSGCDGTRRKTSKCKTSAAEPMIMKDFQILLWESMSQKFRVGTEW